MGKVEHAGPELINLHELQRLQKLNESYRQLLMMIVLASDRQEILVTPRMAGQVRPKSMALIQENLPGGQLRVTVSKTHVR